MTIPSAIAGFRVLRELGAGGTSRVFEAEQQRPRRRVALKVLRALDTKDAIARFHYEAELLARLRHPGIARMLDCGVEQERIPWIALELVEQAVSLTTFADRGHLPVAERVDLFREVCDAVHHAHQRGVVHRDLKPSNILVDVEGRPRLIDFGVARAEQESAATERGVFTGTLRYASPEAVRDQDVDARSDVYSLGVVLYELVVGSSPVADVDEVHDAELARRICETPPRSPRTLVPGFPRDLESILLRALEKDPSRRYPSARAFEEDLGRFRRRETVRARPWTLRYRATTFARRRPAIALCVGIAAIALLGFATANAALYVAEARAGIRAQDRRASAESDLVRAKDDLELFESMALLDPLLALDRRANAAWPLGPEQRPELEAWLEEARALVERLPVVESQLAALTAAPPAGLSEFEITWRRQTLDRVAAWLRRHADDEAMPAGSFGHREPLRRAIERRLALVERVQEASLESADAKAAWARATRDVAAHPAYAGLELEPRFGLLPIGADEESGLHEFADLLSGEAPVRTADGDLLIDDATGVVFVLVPPGLDAIGAADDDALGHAYERPVTEQSFDAFLISKFELTHAQWLRMHGEEPSAHAASGLHPVESVSQRDARDVLRRHRMELPTEAQWEYACRAGTDTAWSCGEAPASLAGVANLEDGDAWHDDHPKTSPVGSFAPNPFGLHDVHGNVREWMLDLTPNAKPYDDKGRNVRIGVTRGGSFRSAAAWCRSAARHWTDERSPHDDVGVRPVRTIR